MDQSIRVFPIFSRISLVSLKQLLPRNPRWAEKGEGCVVFRIKCFEVSINFSLLWAKAPHKRKIIFSFCSESFWITTSVKSSQPILLWLAGFHPSTVRIALSRNTPCSVHFVKSPFFAIGISRLWLSSL